MSDHLGMPESGTLDTHSSRPNLSDVLIESDYNIIIRFFHTNSRGHRMFIGYGRWAKTATVGEVKRFLSENLEGKPREDGILMSCGGRLMNPQSLSLGSFVGVPEHQTSVNTVSNNSITLDFLIRPRAWTTLEPKDKFDEVSFVPHLDNAVLEEDIPITSRAQNVGFRTQEDEQPSTQNAIIVEEVTPASSSSNKNEAQASSGPTMETSHDDLFSQTGSLEESLNTYFRAQPESQAPPTTFTSTSEMGQPTDVFSTFWRYWMLLDDVQKTRLQSQITLFKYNIERSLLGQRSTLSTQAEVAMQTLIYELRLSDLYEKYLGEFTDLNSTVSQASLRAYFSTLVDIEKETNKDPPLPSLRDFSMLPEDQQHTLIAPRVLESLQATIEVSHRLQAQQEQVPNNLRNNLLREIPRLQQQHGRFPDETHRVFVLDLGAIISLIIPILMIFIRAFFIVWVLGLHLDPSRKYFFIGIALIWCFYQTWQLIKKHLELQGNNDDAADVVDVNGNRRRNADNENGRGGDAARARRGQANGADGNGARGNRNRRSRRHRNHSRQSALSFNYWMRILATVGLNEEADELGLDVCYINGQLYSRSHNATIIARRRAKRLAKSPWHRMWHSLKVGVVLFFGSLYPKFDRRRRRALIRRKQLLDLRDANVIAEQERRHQSETQTQNQEQINTSVSLNVMENNPLANQPQESSISQVRFSEVQEVRGPSEVSATTSISTAPSLSGSTLAASASSHSSGNPSSSARSQGETLTMQPTPTTTASTSVTPPTPTVTGSVESVDEGPTPIPESDTDSDTSQEA